eukprot:scaffold34613_cov166-Amphora_coffeaeformis.AAC.9
MSEEQDEVAKGLLEAAKRTEASLLPAIEEHLSNDRFQASQGLDFLDVKNSLLLTYLIELTGDLRTRLMGEEQQESSLERLNMMKTLIDKSRGLDKKLRYQIDKLLAAGSTASTFAAGSENLEEDPLQFRPDLGALDNEKDTGDDDDHSSSDGDERGSDEDDDDEDDELAAARMTVANSRGTKSSGSKQKKKKSAGDEDDEDEDEAGVYRAPRLTAVPYTHDKQDVEAERERRQRRKMRASELAQTLRAQYGDAPEQEDTRGGAELGRQREAARRMAERDKEKARYEEDNMVRLVTSRKEKKDRKRLMREENSNLSAIADLDNVVRASQFGEKRKPSEQTEDAFDTKRHSNGKRKKQMIDGDGRLLSGKGRKSVEAKNSLQEALFGGRGGGGKKKGKRR